jgi:uncharacterized protein YoxC
MVITGGMSMILQTVLIMALVAFIILVACLVPVIFQARRQMEHLIAADKELKTGLQVFLQDSHDLIRNVNELVKRAHQQMEHLDKAAYTVRQWTERADRLAGQVSAAIEPPVLSLVNGINLVRTGVASFLEAFNKPHQHTLTKKE